jgi:DNA repair protein RecO (recombination protein O)
LSQIELESSYKANQSLQYINEVKIAYVYKSLQTNILKTAIVMFLSEVLSSVLKEEEQNLELFDYIETTLQWLDLQEEFSNFHLLFLLELTKHLGFYPDTSDVNQRYFNLNNGLFQSNKLDVYSISGENLDILSQLLFVDFESLETVKLNAKQRQSFLTMLLLYYELHLGSFKKPQSLDIFNQVFH